MKVTAELTAPYQTHPISENETFALFVTNRIEV